MKSLSKCSCSTPLSLGSLLWICCRDDPWILARSSWWEMWVMERKRTFWKMRGHVWFDAVLFKNQHVKLFFCHCWVKLEPPFPLPLPFLLGGEKQEWLTLTKCSFGELPKAELIPCRSWAHGHTGASGVLTDLSTCTRGKGKAGTEGKWSRSPKRGSLFGVPVQPSRAGDERLCARFGSLSLLVPGIICPPRSWGSGMLWLLTLVCLCSSGRDVWAELPGLLTAKEMDLRGTINFAWLFLSQVKL